MVSQRWDARVHRNFGLRRQRYCWHCCFRAACCWHAGEEDEGVVAAEAARSLTDAGAGEDGVGYVVVVFVVAAIAV